MGNFIATPCEGPDPRRLRAASWLEDQLLFVLVESHPIKTPRLSNACVIDQDGTSIFIHSHKLADWQLAHPKQDEVEDKSDGWVNGTFYTCWLWSDPKLK